MESLLRDLDREQGKMQQDVIKFNEHFGKLADYVRQYIEATTIEWARLVVSHPQTLLMIVETTIVIDENDYSATGESEPIRLTFLEMASGEIWDELILPTYSKGIRGEEYHGLTWNDVEGNLRLAEVWPAIEEKLRARPVIIFGRDWARNAVRGVYPTHALDDVYCLHNKAKEFYGEFYELSLEKILGYQGIDKKREQVRDSRDRIQVLAQVLRNLATGMAKIEKAESDDTGLGDLEEHPF